MQTTLRLEQRPQLAFKTPPELYLQFLKFHEAHPLVPKTAILVKALSFFLSYAEQGVDQNLNPLHTKKK